MKTTLAAICFVVGTLLASVTTYAEDQDANRTQPMTYAKDAGLTTKVKAKLAAEHISSLAKIKVDTTNQGAVVLSGRVHTQEEADKAVSIASATEGVTSVKNHIKIKKDD